MRPEKSNDQDRYGRAGNRDASGSSRRKHERALIE